MTTQHTPGPWTACGWKNTIVNSAAGVTLVLHPQGAPNESLGTIQANARLIAAAPDLLAALKDAAARMQSHAATQKLLAKNDADRHYANECQRHAQVWREVIARATGEA